MHLTTPNKEENISQSPESRAEKEEEKGNTVESDRNEAQDGSEQAPSAKRGKEDGTP